MNTPTPPPNYRIIPREYLEAGNPLPSDAILLEDDDQWVPSMIQGERTNSTYITYATAQPLPCFAPPPNDEEPGCFHRWIMSYTQRTRICTRCKKFVRVSPAPVQQVNAIQNEE